jgi:glycosyltransferase involved in cell wall biosynthesis
MRVSWITFAEAYLDKSGTLTSDLASLRYRVLAALRRIKADHHTARIIAVTRPATEEQISAAEASDVVVFSKSFLPSNEELLRRVKAKGAVTIFDVCDNHYDHPDYSPHYRAMSATADQVVCNTEEMALAARPYCRRPPVVIQDPYEGLGGRFAGLPDNPKLLWFGHPSNFDSLQGCLTDLVIYARTRPLSLQVLSQITPKLEAFGNDMSQRHAPSFSLAFQPWSLDKQWEALAACDAVIIPSLQDERKQVKSANRMIEALWAGKPVVAQPMPAYTPFGQWMPIRSRISEGLEQLMTEREQIASRILAAQSFIADQYSPAVIGAQWKQLILQQTPEGVRHEA